MTAWRRIAAAVQSPEAVAAEFRAGGGRVVWTLGWDIPRVLVDAFGLHPVRLVPGEAKGNATDALIGADNMGARGRALIAAIAALPVGDALLISHADAEQPQIFATLREFARCGVLALPPIHFLDLLTIDRPATRRYNRVRIDQAVAWLATVSGRQPDFESALATQHALQGALASLQAFRADGRMTGAEAHDLMAAAEILSVGQLTTSVEALRADCEARSPPDVPRILLSGSEIEDPARIAAVEALGAIAVAEDHGWGWHRVARRVAECDPIDALAWSTLAPRSGPFAAIEKRQAWLATTATMVRPDRVLHLRLAGDDSAAWEAAAMRQAIDRGIPFASLMPTDESELQEFIGRAKEATGGFACDDPPSTDTGPRFASRSRKSLSVVQRFGTYQRDWFAGVRAAAARGEPFAIVNANAPQEVLRAFGIPFVVNQWWASIVAAKGQGARYARLLEEAGLPSTAEAYSAQGVAAALDEDEARAPWGGLPCPDVLGEVMHTDATSKLFQTWANLAGAKVQSFQRSVESRWDIPVDWWNGLAEDWDTLIEPERLDLFEAELRDAITELEAVSGHAFDAAAFEAIMDLVNEQEDFYRSTRDLIARTVPAPVSVVDQMPATMIPQWHRGTVWGRNAARDFHQEVAERVAQGQAACEHEKLRLMIVGRGKWGDMSFYQRWEESHGAVFVCSMYLSLAADGYIRRHDQGRDPLRALAARFITMGDELRMPTWAGAWHVKEARLHQCDGAVAMSDADPLVLRALREAGVPVLELGTDNYATSANVEADLEMRVAAFLNGPAAAAGKRRHEARFVSSIRRDEKPFSERTTDEL